jgi:hypothetical protein
VIAEGVTDAPGDRAAAVLAAEIAGHAAILVGAHKAVGIARTALNAHFAQPGAGRGDATIAVLTSFHVDRPAPGVGRFTVAWAGDTRVYGATGRWFAPLTTPLREQTIRHDPERPYGARRRRADRVGTGRTDRRESRRSTGHAARCCRTGAQPHSTRHHSRGH